MPPPTPPPEHDQRVSSFLSVFNALTLRKILLWGLFIFVTGGSYVLYRHQDDLFDRWPKAAPLIVPIPTGTLRADMIRFVDDNPEITGIQVVDVDLALNTRETIWYYSDDAALTKMFESFLNTKIGPTPWLSGTPDFISLTLSSAVNSVPLCVPIVSTPLAKRVPGIENLVADVCVSPIPPPYASFSGYVSAWVKRTLSDEEKQQLVQQMRIFSSKLQPRKGPS